MTDSPDDTTGKHYQQTPRRKAEFIMPPNRLREKVGYGGLNEALINKAQSLIESNKFEFRPQGEETLQAMLHAMTEARRPGDKSREDLIMGILFQAMLLKTNGGMFHYELVTKIADRLVQFLEVIDKLSEPEIEIIEGFYTTLRAVFVSEIKGDGGLKGQQLYAAIVDACVRYFEKYPQKKP